MTGASGLCAREVSPSAAHAPTAPARTAVALWEGNARERGRERRRLALIGEHSPDAVTQCRFSLAPLLTDCNGEMIDTA